MGENIVVIDDRIGLYKLEGHQFCDPYAGHCILRKHFTSTRLPPNARRSATSTRKQKYIVNPFKNYSNCQKKTTFLATKRGER